MENKIFLIIKNALICILGTGIMALGNYAFTVPNLIAPGGVTGLATIVSYLTGFSVGTLSLLLNIPIFLFAYWILGSSSIWNSLVSVLAYPVFMNYLFTGIPVYTENPLIASVFGGILMGVGLAIVFQVGGSTGGTDLLGLCLQRKIPHLTLGKTLFYIDAAIMVLSVLVFHSLEAFFYALLCNFLCTKIIDSIIYGADTGKVIYIISEKTEAIANYILNDMERGATILDGEGAYSKTSKKILICATQTREYPQLKKEIKDLDPDAFIMVMDAAELDGEGFQKAKN